MAKVKSGQTLRSAERLLEVLSSFTFERPRRGTRELAEELGLAVSTVRRLLLTLREHELLQMDARDYRYSLDASVERLAAVARAARLARVVAPSLDGLRDETEETALLSALDGREGVHVAVERSPQFLSTFNPVGFRFEPWSGYSTGKVLLAWLPSGQLDALLPPEQRWPGRTSQAITNRERFIRHLAMVRRRGCAVNNAESDSGIWAVAAPVRGSLNAVDAAICVSTPKLRASKQRRAELTEAVLRRADEASQALRASESGTPASDGRRSRTTRGRRPKPRAQPRRQDVTA